MLGVGVVASAASISTEGAHVSASTEIVSTVAIRHHARQPQFVMKSYGARARARSAHRGTCFVSITTPRLHEQLTS